MNRRARRAKEKKTGSSDAQPPRSAPRRPSALQQVELLRAAARFDEARELCRRIVEADHANARAVFMLGVIEQQLGRSKESAELMRRAIELKPDFADAYINLGVAFRAMNRLKSAEQAIRKGLKFQPEHADGHAILGAVLAHGGDWKGAEEAYKRALEINPKHARTFNNLGVLMARQERSAEAEEAYLRALEIRPDYVDARFNFSTVHKYFPGDPEIDALERSLGADGVSDIQRTKMKFALGKAYDRTGEHKKAFAYIREANAEMAVVRIFDEDDYRRRMEGIRAAYEGKPIQSASNPVGGDHTPIFVVGPSRSGKTLIESLFARRVDTFGAGERRDLVQSEAEVAQRMGLKKRFPQYLSHFGPDELSEIGIRYIEKIAALAPGARHSVNTLPGHYGHIGVIVESMPRSKVIFCRRNAMDCCMRIFFHYYRSRNEHTYDQLTVARYYARYWNLLRFWKERYGDRILQVNYEDLVGDPAAHVRAIHDYCGIEDMPNLDELQFNTDEVDYWRNYEVELAPMLEMLRQVAPEAAP
jgi:Tfp pilus assembly protein PilF